MEIKIFGRNALEKFLKENPKQYDCVHYTQSDWPELRFVKDTAVESLHLPVDDLVHYEYKMHVTPTAPDVKQFLDFSKNRKKLAIACAAGVSRSSATAYVIAAREFGPTAGLEVLDPALHSPNRLIVYIGSKILDDNNIWLKYVEWTKKFDYDPSMGGKWPNSQLISKMAFDKA